MLLTEYDEVKQMELTRRDALKEGISGAVRIMREDGKNDEEILSRLINTFGLDRTTAKGFLK